MSFSACAHVLPQISMSAGTEPTSVATIRSARTPEGATTAPVRAATDLKEWDVLALVRSLFCGPHHVAASHGLNTCSHFGTQDFMSHFHMNSIQPLFTACEAVKRLFFFFFLRCSSLSPLALACLLALPSRLCSLCPLTPLLH